MQWRNDLQRAASRRCALATLAAVPVSFFGVLHVATLGQIDFNAASAVVYFLLCLVLAMPLALVNSFWISPWVARTIGRRFSAVDSHLILTAAWLAVVFGGYLAVPRLPAVLDWVMVFWYLVMLLGPAVIAGSFVYTLKHTSVSEKPAV